MKWVKGLSIILFVILSILFWLSGCSTTSNEGNGETGDVLYPAPDAALELDITLEDVEQEPDTWYQDCVECQYYFCPPLDAIWQKQISFDNCTDPPTLVHEGECI